ncbi:hypothetical protein L798_13875 [Zootermopsis nevadensis]|uniref:Uncharacterized protein n=1 Tax=Zootermopsis nevadensis TaxID=136037 RepID=A0A067RSC6_ZOONE|nr:hypothetical protein L798_13875 [Zootermopsis nevadensis]
MDPDSAQVREFIERLVEALVSGQLDDVKVNRVYTHPEYDRMFACHHTALCENLVRLSFALQMAITNKPLPEEETPSAVHAALKQRVQRIIEEAMTLPNLKSQVPMQNGTAFHKWDDDITSMTYEDILATAILNKVIEQFQQKTGVVLAPSRMEQAPKYISRVEIGVNNHDDDDSSSQEGLRSWSDSSHTEPLSMTIEECIEEEVTVCDSAGEEEGDGISDGMATTSSELDFYLSGLNFIKQQRVPFPELGVDIVDGAKEEDYDEDEHSDSSQSPHPTDLVSPMNSWEENWLFQRRRLKAGGVTGSVKRAPMPVPMLVPNPSEDFKARIGDRDAEEVSDLSDCSDGALEDVVLAGVETELTDFHLPKVSVTNAQHDDASQLGSKESIAGLSAALATDGSIGTELIEATNVNLVKASSVECLSEFGQQDSEYTEDYASVAQRQLDSLTEQIVPTEHLALAPVPKPRTLPMPAEPSKSSPNQEMWTDTKNDTELSSPPQPGTIAEREHRKWESAPPLPNNPYSTENISRRLSSKSAGFSSLSSSTISVDFPELNAESRVTSPLQVICTSGELDYKRYGRDYYINHSKLASGERYSSSRLNSPLLQQVCDTSNLLGLEQQALRRNIYRNSFRACNSASLDFTINPLFDLGQSEALQSDKTDHVFGDAETVPVRDGVNINPLFDAEAMEREVEDQTSGDLDSRDEDQTITSMNLGQESGYSSLLDSLSDPQAHFLRLLPPSEPQVVEQSFESLASLRHSLSLKDKGRNSGVRLEMGGSLKVRRKHRRAQLALW